MSGNRLSPQFVTHSMNTRMCSSIDPDKATRLSHIVNERGLSESLLEADDDYAEGDCNFAENITFELSDSILPWQDVAPNAKIIVQRRRRVPVHSADEAQVRARNRVEEYSKLNKKTVESLFTTAALWRMCVEQTTYRYIPNNGRYRSSKTENKMDRDGKLARTIRSMEKLSPEQRQLQREIQRELRQEFEMQQKLERQAERNRQRAIEQRRLDSRGQPRSDKMDMRRPPKDPLFHRRIRTPVELPPINVPLMGKSVNDNNYMDSFHVRLNSLEEEMKRDQIMLKKKQQEYSHEDNPAGRSPNPVFRTHSEPPGPKPSHYMDFSGLPLFTEPVGEECLSVRPMAQNGKTRDEMDRDNPDTSRSSRTVKDDDAMRTVFIKYTANNGDVVNIPKYTANMNVNAAAAAAASGQSSVNSSSDQLVLKRPNGQLAHTKTPLRKEPALHAREYLVSTHSAPPSSVATHSSFKYTRAGANHRKLTTNGVYNQDDPPVIVAEGLFTRSKPGGNSENIQVTVTKRKRDKGHDSMAQGFIPGVAGKNCEVSQRI